MLRPNIQKSNEKYVWTVAEIETTSHNKLYLIIFLTAFLGLVYFSTKKKNGSNIPLPEYENGSLNSLEEQI